MNKFAKKVFSPIRAVFFPAAMIVIAISCKQSDSPANQADSTPPEENRFTTTVITQPGALDEPMVFTFTGKDQLVFVERKGGVKTLNLATRQMKTIATIPVNTKYTSKEGDVREAEEGLMGIVAHPNFEKNHWIYMYYADPDDKKHVLARWELHEDSLYTSTKKILLEIPTQREVCCHTGGGMVFDKEGNLYLTTGNNTANPVQGTSALDERPDRSSWDDQRTGGNSNDLRGKILRIHPEDNGTYSVPKGNLFAEGTAKTKPEIYTMGHRNPWRVSVDSKNGFIYWGEVGPDASKDSTIGPRGYDEFNQARKPGFFGWPYFIGNNKAYAHYDYATNAIGENFDTAHVVNNSPNNTGVTELPKPEKAFIWYPYSNSDEFPLVGSSGRSATGGPVFHKDDFAKSTKRFPGYYENKLLIVEFMRGWIMSVTMDEEGNYKSMERFLPKENFSSAIDMKFSPDGDLYVLEYGSAWFRGNENAQIKRIEYNGGNRKPIVKAGADRVAGALPFKVKLSSEGTMDYDNDALTYEWTVKSDNGYNKTFTDINPDLELDKEGVYNVTLVATDSHNEKNSQSFELKAGNDPPAIDINITKGNKTFFFPNSSLTYAIDVTDKEDGSLAKGTIKANEVAINFDYAPEGFDPIEIAQNHRSTDEWTSFSKGQNLIAKSDCKSCHMLDKKSVGPSYQDVAKKYKSSAAEQERISKKIITGGAGVWGDHAMSAHPQISQKDAMLMVKYIVTLADIQKASKEIAPSGNVVEKIPAGDNGRGGYLLRVSYKDKGNAKSAALTSEKIVALRNAAVDPEKAEFQKGTQLMTTPSRSFNIVNSGSYIGFKSLDLTDIRQIELLVTAAPRIGATGGIIEVHLDSPDGKLIGKTEQIIPKDMDYRTAMAKLMPPPDPKAKKKPAAPAGASGIDFNALRRIMSIPALAPIENVTGEHDVYFVVVNPQAKDGQILVQMVEISFQNQVTQPTK
ncbi:MAG: PQQ-dependent sugar dehydrogenase [Chryseolinea sp.]